MTTNSRRRLMIYPVVLLVLGALAWAGFVYRAEPDVGTLVGSAEVLARAGLYDRAVEDAGRALRQEPDHAYAHAILGYAMGQLGRHGESVDHYARAVAATPATEPTRAALRLYHAEALLSAGRPEEAAAEAERVFAECPREYQANYVLGRARQAQGRAGDARAAFQAARVAAPEDPEPLFLLAGLAGRSGDAAGAEGFLDEAVAVSGGSAEAYLRRALHRESHGDREAAVLDAVAAARRDRGLTLRSLRADETLSRLRDDPRVTAALAGAAGAEKKVENS